MMNNMMRVDEWRVRGKEELDVYNHKRHTCTGRSTMFTKHTGGCIPRGEERREGDEEGCCDHATTTRSEFLNEKRREEEDDDDKEDDKKRKRGKREA